MRKLGRTELEVQRVGFGGIPIQRITQEEANLVIRELQNQGVNFIDSARGYTISEEYIGNAIEGSRENWILATKSMSRTYDGMMKDVEISLDNFKTEYIDLYQLHNVKFNEYDNIFDKDMAYEALLECKRKGKNTKRAYTFLCTPKITLSNELNYGLSLFSSLASNESNTHSS